MYRSQQTAADSTSSTAAEVNAQQDLKASNSSPGTVSDSTSSSTAVVTPPRAVDPPSSIMTMLMWLPLVVAMGLWLYLRGRNQANERARAESLAVAVKKQKKAARAQSTIVDDDDTARAGQQSVTRSKGNSKKNKKDKQKKKQTNAGVPSKKANQVAAQASSSLSVSSAEAIGTANDSRSNSLTALSTQRGAGSPASVVPARSAADEKPAELKSADRRAEPVSSPVTKAIFEPMRKVKVNLPDAAQTEKAELDGSEEYPMRGSGRARQNYSNEPQIITTPTKVSGTRFEKLNVPAANAGLGSATNRWPTEASRPVSGASHGQSNASPQPSNSSRSSSNDSKSPPDVSSQSSQSPLTARGLGAFVKKGATSTEAVEDAGGDRIAKSSDSPSE